MTQDDQLIDIGGITAQISSLMKSDLKIRKPIVCIDPSKEMLAITTHSTAEDFLASKLEYPVLFCFCIAKITTKTQLSIAYYNTSNFGPQSMKEDYIIRIYQDNSAFSTSTL